MIVCITEKPSVARDIAEILGARTRRDGFFEGGDYRVTWTYGHLCTLKEPADYSDLWRRWSLAVLPMIPQRFGIKLIEQESIKRQFNVIKSLIANADVVINCGDAGQEGELIQRWVMQKAGTSCQVKRLWISSLTEDAIKEGFNQLKPQKDYDNLYHAGLCRAIGDWILGMNATRLYSLKYSSPGHVLSIGRVQTPTLALIVKRHFEIANFVPSDFWELKTVYRATAFNSTAGRYESEEKAGEALQKIIGKPFTVVSVTEKQGKEYPPRLFDLTSLQVECNKRWGWTADETLSLIQSLYEKKVTTYPRVDTTYLSDDIYPKVPEILRQMTPYANIVQPIIAAKLPKVKRVFDNSKITDHHAIIPTGVAPTGLVDREKLLYHLIAKRFIAAFYPECTFNQTTIIGDVDGTEFKATGKVITNQGWRAVYEGDKVLSRIQDNKNDEEAVLPQFTEGEVGNHNPSLQKKTTQPPKYYSEGTLLRAMETAGNTVDDEELREAMKENGIGRPSTRANIIETLCKRKYIYRERKNIMASQAGIDLIAAINEPLLKSASLTGLWENKLRKIERGDYSSAEFINELKTLITNVVNNVLSEKSIAKIIMDDDGQKTKKAPSAKAKAPRKHPIKSLLQITCPFCGKGHILKGRTAFGCSEYAGGCQFRISFTDVPADTSPAKLSAYIAKNFK